MSIKSSVQKIYALVKDGVLGPLIVFGGLIALPFFSALVWANALLEGGVIFTSVLAGLLVVGDLVFRFIYRLYIGQPYESPPRVPFEDLYIEPHPYIPYVYKPRKLSQKGGPAIYPLHNEKYTFGQYRTNNFRYNNGPAGDRDIVVPKPDGLFRVNCLGASTTGNYLEYEGEVFSYPMLLEKKLRDGFGGDVEVNNCGQGGYNSADIFVRFALHVIETKPDVVVIYHAYNDIRSYLTKGFSSDYSHSCRNLGDSYWKFALAARLPTLPIKFLDFLINTWLPGNIRNVLSDQVSKGTVDLGGDPSPGVETYRRNIKHIVDLCRANDIKVVLNTYCHFLHPQIQDSPVHQLYGEIVKMENDAIRSLAKDYGVPLVDNDVLVPANEKYFVDSIHFTPEGMQLIADNIAVAIMSSVNDAVLDA